MRSGVVPDEEWRGWSYRRGWPAGIGLHDGGYGTFTVLSFPDDEDEDVGYVEHALGAVHIEDADKVRAARLRFEHLADLALDPDDSRALIHRVLAQP